MATIAIAEAVFHEMPKTPFPFPPAASTALVMRNPISDGGATGGKLFNNWRY